MKDGPLWDDMTNQVMGEEGERGGGGGRSLIKLKCKFT